MQIIYAQGYNPKIIYFEFERQEQMRLFCAILLAMPLGWLSGIAGASPRPSHQGAIVKSELYSAIEQNISCANLVSKHSGQSFDISAAFRLSANSAFTQLEELRLHEHVDAQWVQLSKATDAGLRQMALKTSSLGEAVLGFQVAGEYQAVIEERLENKSLQVRLSRKRAVVACAQSLREEISRSSFKPSDLCIEATKVANDALESENKRLDREIESLQKEPKGADVN